MNYSIKDLILTLTIDTEYTHLGVITVTKEGPCIAEHTSILNTDLGIYNLFIVNQQPLIAYIRAVLTQYAKKRVCIYISLAGAAIHESLNSKLSLELFSRDHYAHRVEQLVVTLEHEKHTLNYYSAVPHTHIFKYNLLGCAAPVARMVVTSRTIADYYGSAQLEIAYTKTDITAIEHFTKALEAHAHQNYTQLADYFQIHDHTLHAKSRELLTLWGLYTIGAYL